MKATTRKKRNGFSKLFKLKGEPKTIAKGFALGSFIGMLPFPGFQWIISAVLAGILKWNKTAAIAGVYNTNLATGAFIFAFNYWLGSKILGFESSFHMPEHIGVEFTKIIIEAGSEVFWSLLIGGFITGIIMMFLTYFITTFILKHRSDLNHKINCQAMETKGYTLITGSSKGLGKEMAHQCACLKMNLILAALPGEGITNLGKELSATHGIHVITFEFDLTKNADVEKFTAEVNRNYPVNILINNAGIGGTKSFLESSSAYIDHIILLNMRALVLLTRFLLPNLVAQRKAHILNIASLASFGPMPFKTVYPASKAFVYSFSRGLNAELMGTGVSVSVAHPGWMKTNEETIQKIEKHSWIIRKTTLPTATIAEICIRQMLHDKRMIIPGFINKFSWFILKIIPVWLRLRIMQTSLKKEIVESPQFIAIPNEPKAVLG